MEKNIFELAAKCKFRYPFKGEISTEDLYDLDVRDLDTIWKTLKKEQEKSNENSLLATHTREDTICASKIEIVEYVFAAKQAEKTARKEAAEKSAKRQKILQALYEQQESELKQKSSEELQMMLKELDDNDAV